MPSIYLCMPGRFPPDAGRMCRDDRLRGMNDLDGGWGVMAHKSRIIRIPRKRLAFSLRFWLTCGSGGVTL